MALLLGRFRVTLTWAEILRRTVVDALFKHDCVGMAAQLAYYFFFSLFPALLFLIAVASYFPISTLIDEIVMTLGQFAPPEFIAVVTDQIKKISNDEQGGLLTLGILTALWSSSTAMTAIIDTVNHAYGVEEGRSWWTVRLIAIALTMGMAIFVLASFALIVVGPQLAEPIANALGLGAVVEWTWRILEWPIACALAAAAIAMVYYFAPDVDQEWSWLMPGTMCATFLWLSASLGFRYYVINVTHYTETYGALGGAMVLLLWFYISGFVLLLGAVLNAKIEHAAPIGKNPGEKVEGERQRIAPSAMRRWIAARRRRHQLPPSAGDIRKVTQ
jgi:membrane protein